MNLSFDSEMKKHVTKSNLPQLVEDSTNNRSVTGSIPVIAFGCQPKQGKLKAQRLRFKVKSFLHLKLRAQDSKLVKNPMGF